MYEFDGGRAFVGKNDPYRDYALQVKQACNSAGVPTIHIGYYLRYGREVWSLVVRRGLTGKTLAAEVAIRVEMWRFRGLNQAVLQAIHFGVFNVAAPIP